MPEQEMKSTVFRFAVVRNPMKPTVAHAHRVFVYQASTDESSLVSNLRTIRNDSEKTETVRMDEMKTLAENYKSTGDYLLSESELKRLVPTLSVFAEWLANRNFKLSAELIGTQSASVNLTEELALLPRLWDNLVVAMIVGMQPELREAIIGIIRSVHVLQKYRDTDIVSEPKHLRHLSQAKVMLPASIFPLPVKLELPVITPPVDNSVAETEADLAFSVKYEAIQAAIASLKEVYVEQIYRIPEGQGVIPIDKCNCPEPPTNPDENAPEILTPSRLSQTEYDELSTEIKTILVENRIRVGMEIPKAIEKLQQSAQKQYGALWKRANTHEVVYRVGNAYWARSRGEEILQEEPPYTPPYQVPENVYEGFYYDDGKCRIRPLGMMDFKRVEQKVCCYTGGEVAHIENILQGEYKERSTRRLRKTEETQSYSKDNEKTIEKDSQSTDRYEMEKETAKTIQNDTSFDAGVSIAAGYGPVSVTASDNFATSNSVTESNQQSLHYAKDVTERSLQRIVERVREERITKTTEEFEEINKHILDNRVNINGHVVGVYRWVDKIYEAQVVNYGKRLVLEFMVSEPGAYHIWAMTKENATKNVTLSVPNDPRAVQLLDPIHSTAQVPVYLVPLATHKQIDETNYAFWAAAYQIQVDVPPSFTYTATKAVAVGNLGGINYGSTIDLPLPAGYKARKVFFRGHHKAYVADVRVGRRMFQFPIGLGQQWDWLDNETDSLPITVFMESADVIAFNLEIEMERTAEAFEKWQMSVFQALISAYQNQKTAYQQALSEAQTRRGVDIQGTNPLLNRQIEQTELKKHCLHWLFYGQDFSSWAVWYWGHDGSPFYETNCEAIKGGERAKFFEEAIDWKLMTYQFYPYFWAARNNWKKLYQLNDTDPLFLNFLQAGMAKVLVPVKPGYELAVLYFMRTGIINFTGTDLGFSSYISDAVISELADRDEEEIVAVPEGSTWQIRVPTTLTILQEESGGLDEDGLPCSCEPESQLGKSKGYKLSPLNVTTS